MKWQGKLYIRGDSKIFRFQNGKTESLFLQRKNPRRIAWTTLYRRQHKKGISEVFPPPSNPFPLSLQPFPPPPLHPLLPCSPLLSPPHLPSPPSFSMLTRWRSPGNRQKTHPPHPKIAARHRRRLPRSHQRAPLSTPRSTAGGAAGSYQRGEGEENRE